MTTVDELFPEFEQVSAATISTCGQYRYDLVRRWAPGRLVLWVMLNPSTADALIDDPTIRRCRGFTESWGRGGLVVVNLFAYRATDPDALANVTDPVGPDNRDTIVRWIAHPDVDFVVAAWGASFEKVDQPRLNVELFARRYDREMVCLGRTKAGHPRHPLYVKATEPRQRFGRDDCENTQ